jgi:hypothetical protein
LLRFELFTAVTMKNVVFWDITSQFVSQRKHIISPLQSPGGYFYVRFEVYMAVTMKNAVFWDATPCGSHIAFLRSVLRLLVTAYDVPSSPILTRAT